jgi:Zn-finger in ubiquitin-hydrolases and other protein
MAKPCEHLARVTPEDFPPQRTPGACEECLAEETAWVALRECRSCGHVGCCDSSTGKHATKHFHETLSCELSPCGLDMVLVHETRVSSVNLKLPHGEVVSCRGSIAGDFTARHS